MIQRHKRRSELYESEKQRLLEALRQCREAIIASHRVLDPWSPTYQRCHEATEAIDDLVEHLTGDRRLFWAGSSAR